MSCHRDCGSIVYNNTPVSFYDQVWQMFYKTIKNLFTNVNFNSFILLHHIESIISSRRRINRSIISVIYVLLLCLWSYEANNQKFHYLMHENPIADRIA